MLTDEEIIEIRNRAKLNDNRQIDPLPFARDVIEAVLAKAAPKQEPVAHVFKRDMEYLKEKICCVNAYHSQMNHSTEGETVPLYAEPQPAQAAAIPEGYALAPLEPSIEQIYAGVAMALQVSVHGEGGWSKYLSGLYKQMLSASPKPDKS